MERRRDSKDLARHPVARHACLRGAPVCAHLEADDTLPFFELVL